MSVIEWSDEFSVGIKEMDEQHKELIKLINTVSDIARNKESFYETKKVVEKMLAYAQVHFSTEERLMREASYEKVDEHINAHESFREKISEYKKAFESEQKSLPTEMLMYLAEWLAGHINKMDKAYNPAMKSHGL